MLFTQLRAYCKTSSGLKNPTEVDFMLKHIHIMINDFSSRVL